MPSLITISTIFHYCAGIFRNCAVLTNKLATKIYDLATKFFPLVASWLLSKKVNFEPCGHSFKRTLFLVPTVTAYGKFDCTIPRCRSFFTLKCTKFQFTGMMCYNLPVLSPVSAEYPVVFHFLVLTQVVFCSAALIQSVKKYK